MKILPFSKILVVLLMLVFAGSGHAQIVSLAGQWELSLDPGNKYVLNCSGNTETEKIINLPGSLAENGLGCQTTGSDFGILTPEFKYVGKAWYSRDIEIPSEWASKEIEVFLERVLWESRIYIDGKDHGSRQDALGTPHVHRLGKVPPGKHKLTVEVNNEMIHNIGDKGHAYGEYTQSLWNGIVGRMEISAHDLVRIESLRTFPDISHDILKIEVALNEPGTTDAEFTYTIFSLKTGKKVIEGLETLHFSNARRAVAEVPLDGRLSEWNEFTPEVYVLEVELRTGDFSDAMQTEFGFYEVSHNGTKILINGKPVFLRGNLDCVHFPLTGYPSCSVEDWEHIFRIYKDHGLNHARFHSWCPPEAAFKAANRVGIYLQAEASIWIDWWMSTDMIARGRPEMDTKGHPKGLGYHAKRDSFVMAEMNRVVDHYGNHPSFTMFCIGNELGNSDFEVMKKWVSDLKKKDGRRLYAVSTARQITEVDDYSATHYIQGIGRTRGLNGARTNWDFEDSYGKMDIPIIAHEIGQWPVYPRWSEIDKYSGVLKARNLAKFKTQAEKNGIAVQDESFAKASGALNQIMYKYEIESFLRTPSCAGVQLLSMQDYQGQGEALIGWLDCHWESKGITTPEEFRRHFNSTVPLLRAEKFVWQSDEVFRATAQLSHHGDKDLLARSSWKIVGEKNNVLAQGSFPEQGFGLGTLSDLGIIELDLSGIIEAQRVTVTIDVIDTEFTNSWDFWVYPEKLPEPDMENLVISNEVDSVTLNRLKQGELVLLLADELGTEKSSVSANFYPLYWSLTFFPGQGKTCIGLLLEENHPAFSHFPTSYHSDWQWETIANDAKGFILNDLPASYRPIAQPVDDFHRNNKVGSLLEFKVGEGKLLVCGYNLNSGLPVANQLKHSLIHYMLSDKFKPEQAVDPEWILSTFQPPPEAEIVDLPDPFKGAILEIDAAINLQKEKTNIPWELNYDQMTAAENVQYELKADGIWKESDRTAWHGKQMELTINCPEGILGTLYVHFHDWNHNERSGVLEFEGRKTKLGKHDGEGQWVSFHIMREDSNDGKLVLKTKATTGPNLMITHLVMTRE